MKQVSKYDKMVDNSYSNVVNFLCPLCWFGKFLWAPFECLRGTVCKTHRHCLNICVEPFVKHTGTVGHYTRIFIFFFTLTNVEWTLEISLVAKNDFYVVVMPLCIHMVLLIWLIGTIWYLHMDLLCVHV
jgi:hypothetical protein